MKKAIIEMNKVASNIKWQPCVAHTLQLVIRKGLNPVKLLVLRAKRLIDFFLRCNVIGIVRLKDLENSIRND